MAKSPVCETGETFISRFGVEMRSMCIQTGVIRIDSPTMSLTVMSSAGRHGEDVVVEAEPKKEVEPLQPATNAAAPAAEKSGGGQEETGALTVPSVTLEEAAGGEVRSLEKNHMQADPDASAAEPASTTSTTSQETTRHEKHHFSGEKKVTEEEEATVVMKRQAIEEELEV
jgi:hypothetical protein